MKQYDYTDCTSDPNFLTILLSAGPSSLPCGSRGVAFCTAPDIPGTSRHLPAVFGELQGLAPGSIPLWDVRRAK